MLILSHLLDAHLAPLEPTPFEAKAGWDLLHAMEERHWWEGFASYPAGEGLWSHWHDQGYLAAQEIAQQLQAEREEAYDAAFAWMV
jgi:hypothetical protein